MNIVQYILTGIDIAGKVAGLVCMVMAGMLSHISWRDKDDDALKVAALFFIAAGVLM